MYQLSSKTKKNLESSLGISLTELCTMSADEERAWIESRTQKTVVFSKRRRKGIFGRGNPLLARRKIRTAQDLETKSKELFGV